MFFFKKRQKHGKESAKAEGTVFPKLEQSDISLFYHNMPGLPGWDGFYHAADHTVYVKHWATGKPVTQKQLIPDSVPKTKEAIRRYLLQETQIFMPERPIPTERPNVSLYFEKELQREISHPVGKTDVQKAPRSTQKTDGLTPTGKNAKTDLGEQLIPRQYYLDVELNVNNVGEIIDAFRRVNEDLTDISFFNKETYPDSFHQSFSNYVDYRSFGLPDDADVEIVSFQCEHKNGWYYVSISLPDCRVAIDNLVDVNTDVGALLQEVEARIRQKAAQKRGSSSHRQQDASSLNEHYQLLKLFNDRFEFAFDAAIETDALLAFYKKLEETGFFDDFEYVVWGAAGEYENGLWGFLNADSMIKTRAFFEKKSLIGMKLLGKKDGEYIHVFSSFHGKTITVECDSLIMTQNVLDLVRGCLPWLLKD